MKANNILDKKAASRVNVEINEKWTNSMNEMLIKLT